MPIKNTINTLLLRGNNNGEVGSGMPENSPLVPAVAAYAKEEAEAWVNLAEILEKPDLDIEKGQEEIRKVKEEEANRLLDKWYRKSRKPKFKGGGAEDEFLKTRLAEIQNKPPENIKPEDIKPEDIRILRLVEKRGETVERTKKKIYKERRYYSFVYSFRSQCR